ncbi:MAG: AI-2E family transporter [Paludibacteraceae bacterium]|nr:AI-2E family transporter [Paludibacteraceae bacterium]
MEEKTFTFDRTIRLLLTIAVIVALFFITNRLSSVLLPFIVAWFIAYMLNPLVNLFQYKLKFKSRILSIVAALVSVVLVITLIISALISPIKSQVSHLVTIVNNYTNGMTANTILPQEWQEFIGDMLNQIDLKEILSTTDLSSIASKGSSMLGSILGTSMDIIGGLFVIFIVLLYLIFILLDFDSLSNSFTNGIPAKYRKIVSTIFSDLSTGMSKYFRGQAIIASCVGVLFAIGFSIMGLPMGIIIGLFIGLLNMVPYLQTAGIPICMILGLLQSADTGTSYWIILLEIAAVFCIVQAIQDLILTPKIMGSTLGMKPAVMLLALSIWGSLLGIAGMIIALPLTTVMISLYKNYILKEEPTTTAAVEPTKNKKTAQK